MTDAVSGKLNEQENGRANKGQDQVRLGPCEVERVPLEIPLVSVSALRNKYSLV